jgi:hypothetical protein
VVEQVPAVAWDARNPALPSEWNLGCRFLAVHDRHCSWPSTNLNPTSPVARQVHTKVKKRRSRVCHCQQFKYRVVEARQHRKPRRVTLAVHCRLGSLVPKIGAHANSGRVTAAQYGGARLSNSQVAACICKLCRNMPSSGVRGCELRVGLGVLCFLGYGYWPATSYLKLSGWAHH